MSWSNATPSAAARSFDEQVHASLVELESNIGLILRPLLQELAPLHDEGVMHGGISPAALRFSMEGKMDRDYFNARRREPGCPRDLHIPHAYLAPETINQTNEDSRSDCYALGALLFQIVTGQAPAPAARRTARNDSLTSDQYPQWPGALLEAINRCLALEKTERIANVRDLWMALTAPTDQSQSGGNEKRDHAAAPEAVLPMVTAPNQDAEATVPDQVLQPVPPITISSSAEHRPSVNVEHPFTESGLAGSAESSFSDTPASTPSPHLPTAPAFPSKIQIRDRLANASVGKFYRQNVRELFGANLERVVIVEVTVPEDSGLVLDQEEGTLYGTPKNPGELKLKLTYRLGETPTKRPDLTHEFALTINPDPKSLWKNLPSDPQGVFAKPDDDQASLATPHLTAIAASLRGRSHAHEGKFRDDDFAMHFVEATNWHVLIAADGAGSAKYSRRGSQVACQVAITELANKLSVSNDLDDALGKLGNSDAVEDLEKLRKISSNLLIAAAYQALAAIQKQAGDQQAALRDFNTTFIVVLGKKLESKWFLASFAIGDGGAGAMIDAERVELLTNPDSGEFAGQTVFLTSPQVFSDSEVLLRRTHAAFCDDFRFLAVMTDGITDPIFESDTRLSSAAAWEAWRQQLSQAVKLDALEPGMERALLDYLHFPSPGNHDDRTLILATPTSRHPPRP